MGATKVGDKVRVINGRWYDATEVGIVDNVVSGDYIHVQFSDGEHVWAFTEDILSASDEALSVPETPAPTLTVHGTVYDYNRHGVLAFLLDTADIEAAKALADKRVRLRIDVWADKQGEG